MAIKKVIVSIVLLTLLGFLFTGLININSANALVVGGNVNLSIDSGSIFNVYSPKDIVYNQKKVQVNISAIDVLNEISYINLNDPNSRWKTLCTSCSEYGFFTNRKLTMQEGINNLIIRAIDTNGSVYEDNVTLIVESSRPKISKIFPRANGVSNGSDFSITYSEDNLLYITLVYGNGAIWRNITQNCTSGKNQVCGFSVDLSEFENTRISYYFIVHDYLDPVITQMTGIKVDTISPVVNIISPIEGKHYLKRVPLKISSSEKVKIEYKDVNGRELPWRTLCTNCDKIGYSQSRFLSITRGSHDLYIRAVDDAGNSDMKKVSFEGD